MTALPAITEPLDNVALIETSQSAALRQRKINLRIVGAGDCPGFAAPGQVRRAFRQSSGAVQIVRSLLRLHDDVSKLAPGVGGAQDLIETVVEHAPALPIEQQIRQNTIRPVAVTQALAGFSQFEHAPRDDGTGDRFHAGRQLGRGGDAERLTEHPNRAVEDAGRERVDVIRHANGVRRKRHAALVNSHAQAEAALHAVVARREVGKRDGTGALRANAERRGGCLAGLDRVELNRLRTFQHAAAQGRRGERYADQIGHCLRCVEHRHGR